MTVRIVTYDDAQSVGGRLPDLVYAELGGVTTLDGGNASSNYGGSLVSIDGGTA